MHSHMRNGLTLAFFGLQKDACECWLAYLTRCFVFVCVAEDAPEGRPEEQIHRGERGGVPKSERANLCSGREFDFCTNNDNGSALLVLF